MKILKQTDYWIILIILIIIFWSGIYLNENFIRKGSHQILFQIIGVPAATDWFVDLYGVVAWFEIKKNGADPFSEVKQIELPSRFVVNSFPMNYPRTNFLLEYFGLNRVSIPYWGFYGAIFLF